MVPLAWFSIYKNKIIRPKITHNTRENSPELSLQIAVFSPVFRPFLIIIAGLFAKNAKNKRFL